MPTKERVQNAAADDLPVVNTHCLSTDRTVFTEEGNEDGWISTDLTVTIRR
ncbi:MULTISPECIES: hypothetical protein [Halolamina]|uniref:Uncharacterized protein n=1 Tax=Halolamina pelagica TaxID=699431 RepID=A0A1I5M0Q6_9EURY|nr:MULTISPECIES: hypothetical protein [Halolamina]NHX35783.1 hypothetical protein [Halolamina sp. R1-12]SFP02606.1 hypothetical protein SAMN05216277_10117 [Halolamina pelagica]